MIKVKSWITNFERCSCGAILYITNAEITLMRKAYLLTCSFCGKKYHLYFKRNDLSNSDYFFEHSEEYQPKTP